MNPFSYESELLAMAVLLYLYDSSVLLYSNEALLAQTGNARWSAAWGWSGFVISGKSLCVLNPFTPHHPAFRLSWHFEGGDDGAADTAWTEHAQRLKRLTPSTLGCALGLFVLLPLGLFSALGAYALIPALVAIYGSTIVGIVRLGGIRRPLGLTARRFAGVAFECLACPPFSANMLRRLALAQAIEEPLIRAGARLCDAQGWERLRAHCEARLEQELQATAEGSAARAGLEARKRELATLSAAR